MIINPENVTNCYDSNYPEEFKLVVTGRVKKRLGDRALLQNFGVNLVELAPGSVSALRHWHDKQDEFIYVVSGEITLLTDAGEEVLKVGDCAGFPAGVANGHCLINRSGERASYLEIGDRTSSDRITYPDDDLVAQNSSEGLIFTHKDGKLY